MTTLEPRIEAAFLAAEPASEPQPAPEASDLGRFEPTPYDLGISDDPEVTWAEIRRDDPEAGLGHDYDGPELRSGTPEYEALYAEYQAWAAQPGPEPEAGHRDGACGCGEYRPDARCPDWPEPEAEL